MYICIYVYIFLYSKYMYIHEVRLCRRRFHHWGEKLNCPWAGHAGVPRRVRPHSCGRAVNLRLPRGSDPQAYEVWGRPNHDGPIGE